MTLQGNAPASGQGDDDARPQDDASQTPASTPATEGDDLGYEDPEAAELAAALAAAEAEEKGAAALPQEQQQAQPAAPATPPPAAPDNRTQQPGPVPYDRFKEVVGRARTLEEEVAYLRGALEATRGQAKPANTAPAAPTPNSMDETVAAAEARAIEAARKFDVGEITAEELTRAQTAAAREIANAQVQAAMQASRPAAASSMTDELLLEQHVAQVEATYPALKALNAQQMQFLQTTAEAEAAAAGQPYHPTNRDTMRLREHIGRLSVAFAPYWGIAASAPAQSGNASNTGTSPAQQPGLSPAAQNRLRKMDQAAGLPPDTARMGAAAGTGELTEQAILAMSDDEIAALPPSVTARYLK